MVRLNAAISWSQVQHEKGRVRAQLCAVWEDIMTISTKTTTTNSNLNKGASVKIISTERDMLISGITNQEVEDLCRAIAGEGTPSYRVNFENEETYTLGDITLRSVDYGNGGDYDIILTTPNFVISTTTLSDEAPVVLQEILRIMPNLQEGTPCVYRSIFDEWADIA